MKPFISVIIPTFNRAGLVMDAIDTARNQQNVDVEVIVVDDASRDITQALVSAEAFQDSRIRLITHEKNRGVSAARNTGIEAAHGDYIALLDSDDSWSPLKLVKQFDALQRSRISPEKGVCLSYFSSLRVELGKKNDVESHFEINKIFGCKTHDEVFEIRKYTKRQIERGIATWKLWFGIGSTLFAHRSAIERNGGFIENIGYGEDTEYMVRHLTGGGEAVVVPEFLMLYSLPPRGKRYSGEGNFITHMLDSYPEKLVKRFSRSAAEEFVEQLLMRAGHHLVLENKNINASIKDLSEILPLQIAQCLPSYDLEFPLQYVHNNWYQDAAKSCVRRLIKCSRKQNHKPNLGHEQIAAVPRVK